MKKRIYIKKCNKYLHFSFCQKKAPFQKKGDFIIRICYYQKNALKEAK